MTNPVAIQTLDQYRLPIVGLDCLRCKRSAQVDVEKLRVRYGGKVTLGEIARQVAAGRGCALAQDGANSVCSVRPLEPPVHHWAELDHARLGNWKRCCVVAGGTRP